MGLMKPVSGQNPISAKSLSRFPDDKDFSRAAPTPQIIFSRCSQGRPLQQAAEVVAVPGFAQARREQYQLFAVDEAPCGMRSPPGRRSSAPGVFPPSE